MSRLLGRGKKSKAAKNAAPTPGEAIHKLRGVEEMLAKKQGPNSIGKFGLSFGLKNGLRFHFDSETCLNYKFLNIFSV